MQDTVRLRALIAEYDRLGSLDGGTLSRQARGVRFNGFIADLLRLWGIDARASTVTPAGEIDVSFAFGGHRYIAEAKWEQSKTDAGPLAKLGLRLRQRMRGTIGVFISMAGYTPQALDALSEAGDRSILPLDRSHVEAMVSGLVPPDELLDLVYDHAAYTGEAYAPLLDLLAPAASSPPVTFEMSANGAYDSLSAGVAARIVCTVSGTGLLGLAALGPGKILVAGDDGIAEVDHINRTAVWRVPVRGSHGNPVLRTDGSIMFARRHGIGVLAGGRLSVAGGGFPDRCSLFARSDGSVWVLDPINEVLDQVTPTVVRLGERLGEEERHEISPPPPWPVGAAWLDETRLVLGHQSSCSLIELDVGIPEQVRIATGDCLGLVPLARETLMTVSGHAELDLVDVVTGRSARLGAVAGRPAVRGVAQGDETTTYVAVGTQHDATAIIAVEFEMPVAEVAARTFAASDSGDLAGYRAEVVQLAGRRVPLSGRSDAEWQEIYNDMQRLVFDQLAKPVGDRVQRLGLESSQEQRYRSLDGAWPPGYGGSASCPRWRRPSHEEAWLEASIGLGYRTWPSQRPDDLVLALMLAIMTDRQQHTLLTRFVPVALGDPELGTTIEEILGDVDLVLGVAVALGGWIGPVESGDQVTSEAAWPGASSLALSPRQEQVARRLGRQIGEGPAVFFREACGLLAERPLRSSVTHLVGHLLREVESAVRAVLEPPNAGADVKTDKHRAKIEAVLRELGIPLDDPAAEVWLGLAGDANPDGLARWAHRSALDAPRPPDQAFLDLVGRVELVLDAVLERFEARYFEVFERLDLLLGIATPTKANAKSIRNNFPDNYAVSTYFFSRATAAWISPLKAEGFFQAPPPPQLDEDRGLVQLPPWPESQFLVRVASQAPVDVVDAAATIPATENARVNYDLLKIALACPPESAARLVPQIMDAIGSRFGVLIPHEVGALVVALCQGQRVDEATRLAQALLDRAPTGYAPTSSGDAYEYAMILGEQMPSLVRVAGVQALAMLDRALAEVIRSDSERHRATPGRDISFIWRPSIEGSGGRAETDIRHLLINAVRDAATSLASTQPVTIPEIVAELESHGWTMFQRAVFGAPRVRGGDPETPITLETCTERSPRTRGDPTIRAYDGSQALRSPRTRG